MNKWTPQNICAMFLVLVIGIIFIMVECGILYRSEHGDVQESRQLLDGNIKLIIGMLTGFLIGRNVHNKQQ